jgi:hypothetical protein
MPVGPATAKLEAVGFDAIIERIEAGDSMMQIVNEIGVSWAVFYNFMDATPDRIERSARAKARSAEAWLDRGLDVVSQSLQKSGQIDPSAARAYEQACARRAAIRNPQYRDKAQVEMTGTMQVNLSKQDDDI